MILILNILSVNYEKIITAEVNQNIISIYILIYIPIRCAENIISKINVNY